MVQKRLFGMMALIVGVALAFYLIGCDNGTTGSDPQPLAQSVTYVSEDNSGNLYTLVVTENTNRSARYTAKDGDSFTLKVELFNNGVYSVALTYSGTIESAENNGTAIELSVTVNGEALTITIIGTEMTVITGTIVLDNEEKIAITEPLKPMVDKRALETAINTANTAKQGVVVSVNGADILTTVYWVSQARMDTFTTAITTAQAVYDNASADQSMVDYAKITIETATTVFNGQKQLGTKTGGTQAGYDVYVTGTYLIGGDGQACYWLNGTKTDLSNGLNALLKDMYVSGTDVYISGTVNNNPAYWKNGTFVSLALTGTPGEWAWAEGIAVSGTDVHVVGSHSTDEGFQATYWKNGVRTVLPGYRGHARDIDILNGDVYIVGEYVDGNNSRACYWKNGIKYDLPFPDGSGGGVTGIAIDGENFYILGFYSPAGNLPYGYCYWVNGTTRRDFASTDSSAMVRKIAASDSKIYVAADYSPDRSSYYSAYWTNGVKTDLAIVGSFSQINDMAVIDGDVHIIGINDDWNGSETAYWVNGVRKEYPVNGYGELIMIRGK
jgi:hypothetical protein